MERDIVASMDEASRLCVTPLTLRVRHPNYGVVANIVLETGFWRRAVGGVRMLPDVTEEHVADLARAMTYKFAFLNMPCAGAKGGIIASASWSAEHKSEVLRWIGHSVAHLIQSGLYMPGPDLGFGLGDCWEVLRGAGIATPEREPESWTNIERSPGFATGLTVFVSTVEALSSVGIEVGGASIAVEGFGKVGAAAAKLFADAGSKVVAVSTLNGAIYSTNGLDIDKLLLLRKQYGDEAVLHYGEAEQISHQDLIALSVDVLCPCAGQWTIGPDNKNRLACRVFVAGSNRPIDPSIRDELSDSESILVFPDFVASSGSVLASNLMGSDRVRQAVIRDEFGRAVQMLITESRRLGISTTRFAKRLAEGNLDRSRHYSRKSRLKERSHRLALRLDEFTYCPTRLRDAMSRHFAAEWLSA